MLAAVVSFDGKRLLLGRNPNWPPHRRSLLAGFIEAGESVEDAVRREVWEESGVRVGRVVLHSTQTWPYPNSLMIGVIAQAVDEEAAENVDVKGMDRELEDAAWFPLEDVRAMLDNVRHEAEDVPWEGKNGVKVKLRPEQALATRLIRAVAEGFLTT